MPDDVAILPLPAFQETVGSACNPFLTIVATTQHTPGRLQFLVTGLGDGAPHERVVSTIGYLKHLYATLAPADAAHDVNVVFQTEDMPVDVPSVSWEAKRGWNHVGLVPDIYYFSAHGYEGFAPPPIDWDDRAAKVVWRGSTTGRFTQHVSDLDALPRYRLCQIASHFGAAADVGINAVVQALDAEQEQLISDRLSQKGLLKPFIPMQGMARYRYILDMDGNSNSWNFMMKLRLGCCVLRVDSDWYQWFASRLVPWEHYVPVAQDLSDLEAKIAWCLENDTECAAIGARGAAFARAMTFDGEMAAAAATVYGPQPT